MKRNLSHVSNGNVEEDNETLTKRRLINSNDDSTIQEATTLQDSNNGSSSLDNNSNISNISYNSNTTINQESTNNEYIMNILLKKPHFQIRTPIAPPNLEIQFWKDLKKTKFQNWTREQVATLLLVDKDHFGCNLSFEQAQEFYCRKVDGKFLERIANNLKKRSSIQDGAQVFSRYSIDENIKHQVVDWVGSLIRHKFYYIWNETNLQLYMKSNNIKVGINEKKEDVLEKHFKFKKTSINPNFIYCNTEYYFKLTVISLGFIEFQLKRETFVPSLKSLLNLDHLNSEKIINNECLIKNKILINGSEEEYKLRELNLNDFNRNRHFYSVISPKGNENTKFLTNMASKYPSIIITGNSKDEILLIEHVLSTFPRERIYSSAQLLLITKLIYLLKIVESNLLNNLNMNQALNYLANCQLNTDSCEVIMKYFLDKHFDLIDSFNNFNSISAKLLLEYLNNLKTKYPTLPNDFIICFDKCDLLDKSKDYEGKTYSSKGYNFTFIHTVIREYSSVVYNSDLLEKTNFHFIYTNIYDDGVTIFPTGKLCVSSDIKIHPIYIENNIKMEDFINYFKNSNNLKFNSINFNENEIEILKKMNEIIPIFPMRMDLFEKVLNILNLEFTKIGFSKEWFETDGLLKQEGQLLSEFINLSEESLFKEFKLIWSILTCLYLTSFQIFTENTKLETNIRGENLRGERNLLRTLLTCYMKSFQTNSSIEFERRYKHLSLIEKLARFQILFNTKIYYTIGVQCSSDSFSYLQAKLCYNKWCGGDEADVEINEN